MRRCSCPSLLTFISPVYAGSHLSFIHPAIRDRGSFSGSTVCQGAPVSRDTRRAASRFQHETHFCRSLEIPVLVLLPLPASADMCYFSSFSGAGGFSSWAAVCRGARRSHSASCTKLQTQPASSRHLSTTCVSLADRCTKSNKVRRCCRTPRSYSILSARPPACVSSLKLGREMQHVRCMAAESLEISSPSLKARGPS